MKKLLNNPLVVGLLVVVALVIGFWPQLEAILAKHQVRAASPPIAGESQSPAAGGQTGPTDARTLARRIRAEFDAYHLDPSGRNPFAFAEKTEPIPVDVAAEPAVETQSVRLAAVWLQSGVRLALLDRRIAVTGDRIGFVEVGEIAADGVWLVHLGTRIFLQLGEQHTFTQSTVSTDNAPP